MGRVLRQVRPLVRISGEVEELLVAGGEVIVKGLDDELTLESRRDEHEVEHLLQRQQADLHKFPNADLIGFLHEILTIDTDEVLLDLFRYGLDLLLQQPCEELAIRDLDKMIFSLRKLRSRAELYHSEYEHDINRVLAPCLRVGIDRAIKTADRSLTETLILTLKEDANKYEELVHIALKCAEDDSQIRRVLYNTLRNVRDDIPEYIGSGSSWW